MENKLTTPESVVVGMKVQSYENDGTPTVYGIIIEKPTPTYAIIELEGHKQRSEYSQGSYRKRKWHVRYVTSRNTWGGDNFDGYLCTLEYVKVETRRSKIKRLYESARR